MGRVVKGQTSGLAQPILLDDTGRLRTVVEVNALPSGAATEAKQDSIITELQRANWGKVLDAGMAFSQVSSGGGNVNVTPLVVPDGQTYVITSVWAIDWSSDISAIALYIDDGTGNRCFLEHISTVTAGTSALWSGNIVLPSGYQVVARYYGTTSGDTLQAACMWHRIA